MLILIFVVLRPTMKRLTASHTELATTSGGAAAAGDSEGARVEGPLGHAGEGDDVLLGSDGEPIKLPGGGRYENIMDAARNLVDEDPKRVAQLVNLVPGLLQVICITVVLERFQILSRLNETEVDLLADPAQRDIIAAVGVQVHIVHPVILMFV